MKTPFSLLTAALLLSSTAYAQDAAPENWFNLDPKADGVAGVSTERVYADLLKGRSGETVVVAIIDSGVDAEHEDLAEVMWVNADEIPDNGVDDDNNGYVDDIHGWNFIGGKDGRNVGPDSYEATRVYAKLHARYGSGDTLKLNRKERREFERYKVVRDLVESKRSTAQRQYQQYDGLLQGIYALQKQLGDDFTAADLEGFKTDDEAQQQLLGILGRVMAGGATAAEVAKDLEGAVEYFGNSANYGWNPDFDPRAEIVKDDYADSYEIGYGNNDVEGPDASHGTHVAGIVAAVRDNEVGMKGVADNVRIMSLRAVPDGDERDKDIANAIRYAVDNGAKVVNMSFGKGYSWDKRAVDKAVKYAAKKDVLLVHAAGNSSEDTDVSDNFPLDAYERSGFLKFLKKKYPDNWLEIGALSWKPGEDAVAEFSNYGKTNVDVFSPGVAIYSTTPDNEYDSFNGTSMASPVTAGVAAMLRSYFPELKAKEIKEIILESATPQGSRMVKLPGSDELVPFDSLSVTGGILNAYNAVRLAQRKTGKTGGKPAAPSKA